MALIAAWLFSTSASWTLASDRLSSSLWTQASESSCKREVSHVMLSKAWKAKLSSLSCKLSLFQLVVIRVGWVWGMPVPSAQHPLQTAALWCRLTDLCLAPVPAPVAALVVYWGIPVWPLPLDFCRDSMLALSSSISAFVTCLSVSRFAFALGMLHELCHLSHGNRVLPAWSRVCGLDLQGCLLQLKEQIWQPSFLLAVLLELRRGQVRVVSWDLAALESQ